MFKAHLGKTLLVASAIAGLAFIAVPSPGKAASPGYCAGYAREVADDYAPRRGLIGSVIALPFDVAGSVLTGRTTYDARWQHAYDRAYADCRASGSVALLVPGQRAVVVAPEERALVVPAPEAYGPDEYDCDSPYYAGKYSDRC